MGGTPFEFLTLNFQFSILLVSMIDSQPIFSSRSIRILALLSLAIVLLGLPRFNRNDWLISSLTSQGKQSSVQLADAEKYIATVEWIRGTSPDIELYAPFSYRLLTPLLAAPLPFDSMTSINILNLLFLIGGLFLLYHLLRLLNIDEKPALFGSALFALSFPTFFYVTVGYLDPILLFMLILGLNLIYKKIWWGAALTIGLGFLGKEGVIMLLPVLGVALWQQKEGLPRITLWMLLAVGLWISLWYGVRAVVPVANEFQWSTTSDQLIMNLSRPRSWLTLVLTGATLLIPLALNLIRRRSITIPPIKGLYTPLWVGLIVAIGYYGYSWTTAYVDGRMFWPIYIFGIPLVIAMTTQSKRLVVFSSQR